MAVFTIVSTIAAAIGTALGGGLIATMVGNVIAAGLALGTAKALGVFDPPKQQQTKDPGVKIQLPPSTDNRIPVFYGQNYTGGIIVDAGIKNQNNTMSYVMVIGEKTDSGTYSVDKIFRDDTELVFGSSNVVTSGIDPNSTSSNNINGKLRFNVYAGNAQNSANQIFPATPKVAAQTLLPTIDATTSFEDLVYAVCEIDYDPENGLTGLGAITFRITNSLSEPSNVLLDYCQNSRYGAGLANTDLVLSSFDDMYDYATANVEYLTSANVSAYHDRWRIDGMLSTYNDVKTNINELCKSSSTYFTYDNKNGKFKVVPNREATTAEKANAFVFTDDNITSSLEITSTELFSLYNSIDSEYPSYEKKDQTQTVVVETPAGDRNANEPDNPLNTRYDLVNDRSRVYNLANIDLRQSRLSTVVSFTADYSAIQVDVGDVVKLTSSLYGWSEKLFRCMRVTEIETADAMLGVKVILLEYDDSVYEHNIVQSDGAVGLSGIPGWWTGIVGNANITIPGNITITNPPTANANIVDPGTGNVIGNVDYGNIDWSNINLGGPGIVDTTTPLINLPVTTPNIPGIENYCVDLGYDLGVNQTKSNTCWLIPPPNGANTYEPNSNHNLAVPVPPNPSRSPNLPNGPTVNGYNLNINVKGMSGDGSWVTPTTTVANIPVNNPGLITPERVQDIGVGLQNDQDLSNTNVSNAALVDATLGTANSVMPPVTTVDLGGIDQGRFSALNSATAYGGSNPGGDTVAYVGARQINYKEFDRDPSTGVLTANANTDISESFFGSGQQITTDTGIPPLVDNFDYEITEDRANAAASSNVWNRPVGPTKAYLPNTMIVYHFANSTLSNTAGDRGYELNNADKRQSKADQYRGLLP